MNPSVLAALIGAAVPVLGMIAVKLIDYTAKGRSADSAQQRRDRISDSEAAERFRDSLQSRLERTEQENDDLGQKVLRLERVVMGWETRFATIADDLDRIRRALDAERPEISVAVELLVQMLDKVRRREDAIQEREA
jgi:hypothetical protein